MLIGIDLTDRTTPQGTALKTDLQMVSSDFTQSHPLMYLRGNRHNHNGGWPPPRPICSDMAPHIELVLWHAELLLIT